MQWCTIVIVIGLDVRFLAGRIIRNPIICRRNISCCFRSHCSPANVQLLTMAHSAVSAVLYDSGLLSHVLMVPSHARNSCAIFGDGVNCDMPYLAQNVLKYLMLLS